MKKLLDSFLNFFNTTEEDPFYYVKIERNEKCYCDSGKKYKSCHYPEHQKRSRQAVRVIKESTGEETIKVLSIKKIRKEHFRVKTTS
jgi:uncharacterized protein YchJ